MVFNKAEQQHYSRQLLLPGFGPEKQARLKAGKVLVVGAGGLGCPALLYLAGAGVGTLGIVDGDTVDQSNLHRQGLYTTDDLGANKAQAAAQHLRQHNPHIQYRVYDMALTPDNALAWLSNYDIIVDGTDNFATRYLINDACVILNKPFVYGSVLTYEGQFCVFNYQGGPTYRCLFPKPPLPGQVPSCAESGVLGVLPGLVGMWQATAVIKILTGLGEVHSGKLRTWNLLDHTQHTLEIPVVADNKTLCQLSDYKAFCGDPSPSIPEITIDTLKAQLMHEAPFLLDVREAAEVAAFSIGGIHLPLHSLPRHLHSLPRERDIVVVCQSGQRSKKAAHILLEAGFTRIKSLTGGLALW